jgi:hypothetical protein
MLDTINIQSLLLVPFDHNGFSIVQKLSRNQNTSEKPRIDHLVKYLQRFFPQTEPSCSCLKFRGVRPLLSLSSYTVAVGSGQDVS